jgi:hypothetical protein
MAKRSVVTILGVLAVWASLAATSASAATEFGDPCVATSGTGSSEYTIFGLSSTSPLPIAAPSAGVITSWKLNLTAESGQIPPIIPQTLKAMRVNPATHVAQVVGEASGLVGSGPNTIPARIPVEAGDHLAVYGHGPITFEGTTGEVGTLVCEGSSPVEKIGVIEANVPSGASASYTELEEIRVPAVAVLEVDSDHDGYGDETQDACPQSAASQAPCPLVTLSTGKQVKKGAVVVSVRTNTPAPVSVKGVAKLGKGKKATLKGGTKNLTPGVPGKFTLKFSKSLKAKLGELSRKQSLSLKVTIKGTNVAGQVTTKTLKIKLEGQG